MAEKKITIQHVHEALSSLVDADGNYVRYHKTEKFTMLVKSKLMLLATKCQVKDCPEYYKIDHTYWDIFENATDTGDDKFNLRTHEWKLLALIEHENDSKDWYYEVLKLAPFYCPLRVVIGYRNDQRSDEDRLEKASDMLKTMKEAGSFCNEGEFWIVLGNTGKGKADYKFYKYQSDNNKFEYNEVSKRL